MSAFADILRKADAPGAPAPGGSAHRDSVQRAQARRTLNVEQAESWESTLTTGHQMAFHWLRNDDSTPFGLVSCFVNGDPSALIVAARPDHRGRTVEVIPLFIALTPGMRVTAPDGELIWGDGGVA